MLRKYRKDLIYISRILESKVETYFKEQINNIGGICFKFKSTVNAVPDQLVAYNGNLYLVELKRPKENLRPNQVYMREKFNKQGITVYMADDFSKIDIFIKDILKAKIIKKDKTENNETIQQDMFDLIKE